MNGFKIQPENKEQTVHLQPQEQSKKFLINKKDTPSREIPRNNYVEEEEEKRSVPNSDESDAEELFPTTHSTHSTQQQTRPSPPIQRPVPRPKPTPSRNGRTKNQINTFDNFINPDKVHQFPRRQEHEQQEDDGDDDGDDDGTEYTESVAESEYSGNNSVRSVRTSGSQKRRDHFRIKELLHELRDLESRGYSIHNEYNIKSRLSDLENEVKLGNKYFQHRNLQKMGENMFFIGIRGIENAPLIWNPLGVNLNGLVNSTVTQKNEISYCISEIIKKWFGPESDVFGPELTLVFILVSTIVTTAMTNAMMNQVEKKMDNPDFMGKVGNFFQGMISSMNGYSNGNSNNVVPSNIPSPNTIPQQQYQQPQQQQRMQAPQTNSDINDLFTRLVPNNANQNRNIPLPNNFNITTLPPPENTRSDHLVVENKNSGGIDDSDRFSVLSSLTGFSEDSTTSSRQPSRTKRRTKKNSGKKSINIF